MTFRLNTPYSDIESGSEYINLNRIDLLCGFKWKNPIFPCRICGKETCEGKSEQCKGEGAYVLGLSYKD